MFRFSQRSKDRLVGVHPDLVKVATRALELTPVDFGITEGVRSLETQKKYFAEGKSQTMKSRHLHGFAVDVVAYPKDKDTWNMKYYRMIADAFKQASKEFNIPIKWGGDFLTFKDGVHFELLSSAYPDPL